MTTIVTTHEAGLPPRTFVSLRAYVEEHKPVGGFLQAVLENNLQQAVQRADADNLPLLPAYVDFLTWEAPAACWGSSERVSAWLAAGRTEGAA